MGEFSTPGVGIAIGGVGLAVITSGIDGMGDGAGITDAVSDGRGSGDVVGSGDGVAEGSGLDGGVGVGVTITGGGGTISTGVHWP